MSATTEQKVDFLLKKVGFTLSKTGSVTGTGAISGGTTKEPFAESIPSPLVVPDSSIWNQSLSIPTTPPGSNTSIVRVYSTSSAHRMTADSSVSGSRAFIAYTTYNDTSSARLSDWIDTQFGTGYVLKVYKGDPNSGGTLLPAGGSGSNDGWFFDYSSGVLNFNGSGLPSGVSDTNIYIVGYRYIGSKGVSSPGQINPTNLFVSGISTFAGLVDINAGGQANTFKIEDLTAGRVVLAGTSGEIEDSGNLTFNGDTLGVTGSQTISSNFSVTGISTLASINVSGIAGIGSLTVAGVSTFTGNIDANGNLDVDGQTDLDILNVAELATFTGNIDANGSLDVDGHTELDNLGVSGVSTFVGVGTFQSDLSIGSQLKGFTNLVAPHSATTKNFTVTVASKDASHRYNGTGSGNAYLIDGIQSPILTLTPGRTYRFVHDNTGSHPLKFYLEADKTTNYTTGVNFQNTYTEITIGDETPNVLHYQCTAHGYMGNAIVTNSNVVNSNYAATLRGGLSVTGAETTLSSATVSDLTDNRVVIAGTSGALEDSSNLTFNGSQLGITGTVNASSTITGTEFHTGSAGSAIRVTSNTISGPATFTLDPATIGDNTGKVIIAGDLQVDGTTTTVNSTTVNIVDKNIQVATGSANDAAANGGGITIASGDGNKTFQFEATGDNLASSEHLNIASGKSYKINNTSVLNATTLGSGVVNSSLTSVGTLTSLDVSGLVGIGSLTVVGVSTFSDNIILPDDKKIQLGDNQDLEILHDPSNGIIRSINSGGNMHVESKNHIELNVNYNPSSGSKENALKAIANAGVTLYYNGLGKFSTTNTGASVTGDLTLTDTDDGSAAGPELKLYRDSASPADADYLGQIKFAGESDTGVETNYAKITGKILDASNGTEDGIIEFAHIKGGSQTITGRFRSDSLQLLNGTNFSVAGTSEFTDTATFTGNIDANGSIDVDGHTELDNLGVSGITTFSDDVTFLGTSPSTSAHKIIFDKSSNHLQFFDNTKANFGQSADLQIYHLSNINYIDCTTSAQLLIQSDDLRIRNAAGSKEMLIATADKGIDLYFNAVKKLATDVGGVIITGVTTSSSGFSGDLTGNADTATLATRATDLAINGTNQLLYQASNNDSAILPTGNAGQILQSNGSGNAPQWVTSAPAGAIEGITVRDESSIVGSANSISTINFVGQAVTADAAALAGIATVTIDAISGVLVKAGGVNAGTAITAFDFKGSLVDVDAISNTGIATVQIDGLTVKDEGSTVGTANSITAFNFVGDVVTATASGETATVTVNAIAGLGVSEGSGAKATGATGLDFVGPVVSVDAASNTGISTVRVEGLSIKDEGSTVGTAGSITTINFVGAGIAAAVSGETATVTSSGASTDDVVALAIALG